MTGMAPRATKAMRKPEPGPPPLEATEVGVFASETERSSAALVPAAAAPRALDVKVPDLPTCPGSQGGGDLFAKPLTMLRPVPAHPPRSLNQVLAAIAEIAGETLELQDVFGRVALAIRELVPFDSIGVVRVIAGEWAVLHAAAMPCGAVAGGEPAPLSAWSPRVRPRAGAIPRVDDAQREFDPSFPFDAKLLAAGVRSCLWEPFRSPGAFTGGIWLAAFQPAAFDERHQEVLRPIAALLGSAVSHWRIWDAERRRRERLDHLEGLLGALAEALDPRTVFPQLSAAVQPALPHDILFLTELDNENFRVVAAAGDPDVEPPSGLIPMAPEEAALRGSPYEIVRDLPLELPPTTARNKVLLDTGMRSWLRVPVRLWGEVRGSLGLLHREPSRYSAEDVEVAERLADRVALAMSHHRLAEEARTANEARERAERLEATVATLTEELAARVQRRIVGVSRRWRDVLVQVARVAPSETTVLVTGESGTGKEEIAQLLHQGSSRAKKPFVAINCAALPDQLLESELFGHERGAFTGAVQSKIGRLEQAAGGTLFLDEIGEMSPLVQAKFLRVLQEREFQRLGGARTLRADVRVVAATNRDLQAAMARGEFREDLFYRLNVFAIALPALRERPEDVLPLAEAFLEDLGRTMGRPAAGISRDARGWLLAYPWPGNVRELRNAIERAILLCDGGLITREHLPVGTLVAEPRRAGGDATIEVSLPPGGVDLEVVERSFVEKALRETSGNKSRAARLLGLTRAQLYSRLEKYGLA
jgi:Nif-specific regulatory protein